MAGGDVTLQGPFNSNAAGLATSGAAMDTLWDGTGDTFFIIPDADGRKHHFIHIEGN